jgi:hypothetical protein
MPIELQGTYAAAAALKAQVRALRPTLRLLIRRSPLDEFERRLDEVCDRLVAAWAQIAAASIPVDLNAKLAAGAVTAIQTAAHEATRAFVAEAYRDIGDIRNRLMHIDAVRYVALVHKALLAVAQGGVLICGGTAAVLGGAYLFDRMFPNIQRVAEELHWIVDVIGMAVIFLVVLYGAGKAAEAVEHRWRGRRGPPYR